MTNKLQVCQDSAQNNAQTEPKAEAQPDAKAAASPPTKPTQVRQRRPRGDRKEKSKEPADKRKQGGVPAPDSNVLLFGSKKSSAQYMNLVKGLFMNSKHETLELRGTGDIGNIQVARVSNILKKWGYIEIV